MAERDEKKTGVLVGLGAGASLAAVSAIAAVAYHRAQARDMADNKPVTFEKVDPRRIKSDPATFQFKSGGDEHGVTERLKGVTKWDPVAAGKTVVWERADGERFIADGHQRRGLALRAIEAGQKNIKLDAYVMRERDGWHAPDVRAYAALKNMKESSGNALDMAKVVRERPDLINGSVPMSDAKVKDAVHLSRLSQPAFDMVANGVVKAEHAAAVGEAVHDTTRHAGLLAEMKAADVTSAQHARLYVAQSLAAPAIVETTGSLFGEETQTRSLLKERAQVLDRALTALKSDKKLFGLLEREAANIESAGNRLAHETNIAKAEGAGRTAALVERLSTTRGPVSSMLDEAAMAVAKGDAPGKAARQFVSKVGDTLRAGGMAGLLGDAGTVMKAEPTEHAMAKAAGQTSFLGEPTTKEKIAAESRIKARAGGHEAADHGLFGSDRQQMDLVDEARKSPGAKAQSSGLHGTQNPANQQAIIQNRKAKAMAKSGNILGDAFVNGLKLGVGIMPTGFEGGPSDNSRKVKAAYKKATGEKPPKGMSLAEMKRQTRAAKADTAPKSEKIAGMSPAEFNKLDSAAKRRTRQYNDGNERQVARNAKTLQKLEAEKSATSAKRAAAAEAYKSSFGVAPPARMSIAKMEAAVSKNAVAKVRTAKKNAIAGEMGKGGGMKWLGAGDSPKAPKRELFGKEYQAEQAAKAPKGKVQGLTNRQKLAIVQKHGVGGAFVMSQLPTETTPNNSPLARVADKIIAKQAAKAPVNKAAIAKMADFEFASRAAAASAAAGPSRMGQIMAEVPRPTYGGVNLALGVVGTGVAAGRAYREARESGKSRGSAAASAGVAAAPGVGLMAAHPVGNALTYMGKGLTGVAGSLIEGQSMGGMVMGGLAGAADMPGLQLAFMAPAAAGGVVGTVGWGMRAAGAVLRTAGKVAAPLMAGYGGYEGAKADTNKTRGAVRGALSALDPTAIFMKRGLAERAVDAVAGRANGGPQRLGSGDARSYSAANERFKAMRQAAQATSPDDKRRGWSNAARIGAAKARNVANLPYGGDPNSGPETGRPRAA